MTETERDTHRNYRRQGAVSAVLVAYLGGRRVVAVGPQGLRRAGRADAGPAAIGRGAAGRFAVACASRFHVEGQGPAAAAAPPGLSCMTGQAGVRLRRTAPRRP